MKRVNTLNPQILNLRNIYRQTVYLKYGCYVQEILSYKILQEKNTCGFIVLPVLEYFLIKLRDFSTCVFLWIMRNFYEHLFCRTSANGSFWFNERMRFFVSFLIEVSVFQWSGHQRCSMEKVVFKNFAFTAKYFCWSLFLIKL